VYEDVVETEPGGLLVGDTFNVDDNSALLVTEAQIDPELDSIDLVATRTPFGQVDGLSKNGKAVGNAIEKVYDNLDPDSLFGQNVAELFALADGDYQDFLDQLTGAEHAQMLQSVLWSTRTIKRTITERMECDAYGAGAVANVNGLQVRPTADLAPEAIGCFTPGTGHVWGRASGTWNQLDGDNSAPGYDETQISFTAGADYAFTDSFYAGIAGGWISSEMDFDNFGRRKGASADYEGWHVAGYGGYDNRLFYLRGIVDYANYDGETHRDIRQGISLVDPSSDEADSWVFNFYGEAGYRWEFSPSFTLTPFVGVDVGHAELDEFTEDDPHGTGWALDVEGGEADSVETLVGVRFGGFWDMAGGMFRPDVMVAWAHEFDDPAEVDMAFAENPNARFTVVASDVADDSLVAGVGGTFDLTNQLRFGVKWDGRFNEDYDSNSVIGRIEYKF
jgi:subtilase-type serine protease